MNREVGGSLILGAASKLGSHVLRNLATSGGSQSIIAADTGDRQDLLVQQRKKLGARASNILYVQYNVEEPNLGFGPKVLEQIRGSVSRIFHLAHIRDRTQNASTIIHHNKQVGQGVFTLARECEHLSRVVVVTDVGLTGDYPGRFSESWVDVGQTAFDEVDRSSLEIELLCLEAKDLPITRARVGLLSDVDESYSAELPEPKSAVRTLIPFIRVLSKLPKFLKVPVFVSKDCLAPLTPTEWAGDSLVHFCQIEDSVGKAIHLTLNPPPPMLQVLTALSVRAGGASLKRGLSIGYGKLVDVIPGLTETTKRQADQMASWWTPHRYCLSKNDLDVSNLKKFLCKNDDLPLGQEELEASFFRLLD